MKTPTWVREQIYWDGDRAYVFSADKNRTKDTMTSSPKVRAKASAKILGPLEALARLVALGQITPGQAKKKISAWSSTTDIEYTTAYGTCTPTQLRSGLVQIVNEVFGVALRDNATVDNLVRRLRTIILEDLLGNRGPLGNLSEMVSRGKMTDKEAASTLDALLEGKPVVFHKDRISGFPPEGFYKARSAIIEASAYENSPIPGGEMAPDTKNGVSDSAKDPVKKVNLMGQASDGSMVRSDGTGDVNMASFSPTDRAKNQAKVYKNWVTEIYEKIALDSANCTLQGVEALLGQMPSFSTGEVPSYEEVRRFLRWAIGHSVPHNFLVSTLDVLVSSGYIPEGHFVRADKEVLDFEDTPIGNWLHSFTQKKEGLPKRKAFVIGLDHSVVQDTRTEQEIRSAIKDTGQVLVETPQELATVWLQGNRGGEEKLIATLANLLSSGAVTQTWANDAIMIYKDLEKNREKAVQGLKELSKGQPVGTKAKGDTRPYTDPELELVLSYVTEAASTPKGLLRTADFIKTMATPESSWAPQAITRLPAGKEVDRSFVTYYNHLVGFYPQIEFPKAESVLTSIRTAQRERVDSGKVSGAPGDLNANRRTLAGLFAEGYITHEEMLKAWASALQWGVMKHRQGTGTDRNRKVFDTALDILDSLAPKGMQFDSPDKAWESLLRTRAYSQAVDYHGNTQKEIQRIFSEMVLRGEWSKDFAARVVGHWKTLDQDIKNIGDQILDAEEDHGSSVSGRKDSETTTTGRAKEKAKMSKKDIAIGTVKGDLKEIALRTGVKRTRAALTAKVTDFWTARTVTRLAGESDADYAVRAAKSREGVSAFLLSDAGQNALAYLVGMAWPMLEDQIEDEKVREYGSMVAREIRIQGGTDLLDGFLVEVALPLLALLSEEAKSFGKSVLAPAMEAHTPKVRVDHAADTAANDIRDREIADLKRKLEALEANATPPVAPQVRNAFGG